ncbi:MAG: citrate lyase subunit alpha [Lachnospiraceae bacterium]
MHRADIRTQQWEQNVHDCDRTASSGRIPAICTEVTTVTTPGESVDIVVTDYGVAVNPRRPDLLEALKGVDSIPLYTIEELRDMAYEIVGEPEKSTVR